MSGVPLTIVTPSFNQARYVARTIDSVLSQGIGGVEYLIVDGGSTDGTAPILRAYGDRVRATIEPDAGQADAVNKGLRRAAGDVIGWLNSDDVYSPGAFHRALEVFARRPDVDVVYGEADHIDGDDRVIEPYGTEPFDYERLKDVCFICQPAVFFRRSIVARYGVLRPELRYCMDYEYWLRIFADRAPYFLRRTLAGSRLHAETKTLGEKEAVHREIVQMLRAKLGTVPSRWLHNLAHVIVRERGLVRDTPHDNLRFVEALVRVTEAVCEQYRGGVPPDVRRTLDEDRAYAQKAAAA